MVQLSAYKGSRGRLETEISDQAPILRRASMSAQIERFQGSKQRSGTRLGVGRLRNAPRGNVNRLSSTGQDRIGRSWQ